jgi:hypothetical protein
LTPIDRLGSIQAHGLGWCRRLEALASGPTGSRCGQPFLALAFPWAQRVQDALPHSRAAPAAKIVLERMGMADSRGHHAPWAPRLMDVKHTLADTTEGHRLPSWSARALRGRGQPEWEHLPWCVAPICGLVPCGAHRRPSYRERVWREAWDGLSTTFSSPPADLGQGFKTASQAFGSSGVSLSTQKYLKKIFVPTLDTTGRMVNGLVVYEVVVSMPFIRKLPLLEGLKLYWQRGQDNVRNIQGVLGGGNIIGGVLEGGRWDVRFEFVETRDAGSVWHTHPTYTSRFAFQQFVIGHPIGGSSPGIFWACDLLPNAYCLDCCGWAV